MAEALGVDPQLLAQGGAVYSEVACQMAEGALHRSRASLSLSLTGVLGPDTDEDGNSPGLIILALPRKRVGKEPSEVLGMPFATHLG